MSNEEAKMKEREAPRMDIIIIEEEEKQESFQSSSSFSNMSESLSSKSQKNRVDRLDEREDKDVKISFATKKGIRVVIKEEEDHEENGVPLETEENK